MFSHLPRTLIQSAIFFFCHSSPKKCGATFALGKRGSSRLRTVASTKRLRPHRCAPWRYHEKRAGAYRYLTCTAVSPARRSLQQNATLEIKVQTHHHKSLTAVSRQNRFASTNSANMACETSRREEGMTQLLLPPLLPAPPPAPPAPPQLRKVPATASRKGLLTFAGVRMIPEKASLNRSCCTRRA